ncbi:TIGR04282 family arsenosugar biosynthesis glycosyltransferase [Desulfoprunum benzoelyticum]|uniref:Glycosyltransferase n=1 Tax=Desulfoprunum benzoelyticum TaxID=1506996 RepID=A0A840UZE1_9BACT|nr:TIGR04282 family arsenosugar biosynthesis glycosyltransferase [Desulfoprunum benzoelyticum]MBB5348018.1 hypothetical protein [Desulfoprunum benzoelyticum]MBM9530430.1 TIGR04282 family arsenosugar biosynthesis glycosyltransferase [Desulfoprunum benzoelyticum]
MTTVDQDAQSVVALFVRVPIPGRVKTRLAAAIGERQACTLYQAMVTDVLAAVRASGLPLYLFHDDRGDGALPAAWVDAAVKVVPQSGGDIGERMAAGFAHCFAEGMNRVMLVGSDIPALHGAMLTEAARAQTAHDVVLAPASDGGYCLIALRRDRFRPELFEEVPWSSGRVLAATLQLCGRYGLDVQLLPTLSDIDTVDDLRKYADHPVSHAATTNRALREIVKEWNRG